jgi:hypothetical protein
MQYALLIYETSTDFAGRDQEEAETPYIAAWRKYYQDMVAAGVYAGGNPLEGPESATTVRLTDATHRIQDGPYAETKEQLGGILLLELASLDAALDWAARCPAAVRGAVEVRPLAPHIFRRVTSADGAE